MKQKTVVGAMTTGVGVPPLPPRIINRIALVVDKSGSIADYGITGAVLEALNDQLMTIKKNAHDLGQETQVSLYLFNNVVREVFTGRDSRRLEPLSRSEYRPDGMTAIGNAVNRATSDLLATAAPFDADVAYLVMTLTDGEQNSGSAFAVNFHREDFSYAFLVPNRAAKDYLVKFGVPAGNIREWAQTTDGAREASQRTSQGFDNYFTARSTGARRTESFYTDLSKVTPAQVRKLEPVTGRYYKWQVPKEAEIAEFVREKGIDYRPGLGFYELTKREKVQSHKAVVIEDRATGALYGGPEAKTLVGIPSGTGVSVNVVPGNHANYRIYIGSTSMNRKLVRGSSLLYAR